MCKWTPDRIQSLLVYLARVSCVSYVLFRFFLFCVCSHLHSLCFFYSLSCWDDCFFPISQLSPTSGRHYFGSFYTQTGPLLLMFWGDHPTKILLNACPSSLTHTHIHTPPRYQVNWWILQLILQSTFDHKRSFSGHCPFSYQSLEFAPLQSIPISAFFLIGLSPSQPNFIGHIPSTCFVPSFFFLHNYEPMHTHKHTSEFTSFAFIICSSASGLFICCTISEWHLYHHHGPCPRLSLFLID